MNPCGVCGVARADHDYPVVSASIAAHHFTTEDFRPPPVTYRADGRVIPLSEIQPIRRSN